jgi:hypothetical protein
MKGVKSQAGELVRLEVLRFGGRLMTSVGALQRFGERLAPTGAESRPSYRPPATRRKNAEAAGRRLAKAGI